MNPDEIKRLNQDSAVFADWLHVNYRQDMLSGLQAAFRGNPRCVAEDYYGHVLERCVDLRAKILQFIPRADDRQRFIRNTAYTVARNIARDQRRREARRSQGTDPTRHVEQEDLAHFLAAVKAALVSDYVSADSETIRSELEQLPGDIRRVVRESAAGRSPQAIAGGMTAARRKAKTLGPRAPVTKDDVRELLDRGHELLRKRLEHLMP